ncbi:MAG: acyltransferase [Cellvibrio sp.]|uniref:acyltransferase family protein n=1 Tax=Cellvibrio sp. TaxID=1965322 RepID=UPI0031B14152
MNLFIEAAKQQGFNMPLHALRGVAAVIVLLFHLQGRVVEAFGFTFPPIFNGSAAVTFFFVLSGLVVGASLAKSGLTSSSVALYFHRRVFRIMPLMIVTVTIGGIYLLLIDPQMRYPLNPREYGDFTPMKFIVGYVGYSLKANPPSWSIFVELIGSILIPLMLLSGTRLRNVLLTFVACIALSLIPVDFKHYWHFYMISFFVGLTVLLWGKWLAGHAEKLPGIIFWLVVLALSASFYLVRPVTGEGYGDVWIVYWETASIAPVVAIIFYLPQRFSLLNGSTFKFLGDVSYSLYLTHSILLVTLLNAVTSLMGNTGIAAITYCAVTIVCCLVVAQISYRVVEVEGSRLGERLRRRPKVIQGAA